MAVSKQVVQFSKIPMSDQYFSWYERGEPPEKGAGTSPHWVCAGAHSRILGRHLPLECADSLLNPENGKYFAAYYSYLPRLDH